MVNKKFLVGTFLSLLNASQAFFRENEDNSAERRPPASAKEMKALMEDRARRRLEETPLDADGLVDDRKGEKRISENGAKKINGDEIELSFMITMNEFADTVAQDADEKVGDKFVFSGPMTTADDNTGKWQAGQEQIGTATGSCVVCLSEPQWCCDVFFTFDKNGEGFFDFATVSASGYVTDDEGKFWVGGAGGDFVKSHNGEGDMILDPFFNPIFYFRLSLRS